MQSRRVPASRLLSASRSIPVVLLLACAVLGLALPAAAVGIYDIQFTTDPSGNSPMSGQTVTTSGVVTATRVGGFIISDGPGAWHGVSVFTYRGGPAIGDSVQVTGRVQEVSGMTQLGAITSYQLLSTGHIVAPFAVAVVDAGQEAYESVLLSIGPVIVTEVPTDGTWVVDSLLVCDDMSDYVYFPDVGDELDSVVGVLFYAGGVFKLEPRCTSDIAGTSIPHYALRGDVVTMNDARDVLSDHYVEIQGDRIMSITSTPPPGVSTVETGGLIFPGLIDAHNHPSYNILDLIPFDATFEHRDEWRASALYGEFGSQYSGIRDYGGTQAQLISMYKLAELRALCSGTTTIQGVNCNGDSYSPYAHQGMGINNAERFPARILSSTFPLNESSAYWAGKDAEGYWDRFVIHLAEGTNATALDEFAEWLSLCTLDERTTIIHGVALGESEWASLAAAGSHLVWSPRTNVALYGSTADASGALSAGVNVALAPDWTESGSRHILDEMQYARFLSDALWEGALSSRMVVEMVTRSAADALGSAARIGQIAVGYQADLMVVPGSQAVPYDELLAAEPSDVVVTVVSGRPMYGDPSIISQFAFLSDTEDIVIGGVTKRLATSIDANWITGSDMTMADVIADLEAAYDAVTPRVCCFLGIEPDAACAGAPLGYVESYEVGQGGILTVAAPGVLANDYDENGDGVTSIVVTDPDHGLLDLAANGGFSYEHDGTATSTDAFVYRASDGGSTSNPIMVSITVLPWVDVADNETELSGPSMRVHPNPFNPATSIYLVLPEPNPVFVAVYDLTGRRLAVLADRQLGAGEHVLGWSGRDTNGESAASGVYFIRMVTGESEIVRKVALVK